MSANAPEQGFGLAAPTMPQFTPEQLAHLKGESKQSEMLGVIISFTVISFITVLLRYYTRFVLVKNYGPEDYLIGLAMASSIAMFVCMYQQVVYGTGLHAMFLTLEESINGLKALYGNILTYNLALTFIKFSILFQYHRLFISRYMRYAVYVASFIIFGYGTESFFTHVFSCRPIKGFWDPTLEPQHKATCLPRYSLWYANGSLNIFTDIMIAIIPLPEIRKLQIHRRKKIAIGIILGLGWLVCIVSILRLYTLRLMERHMSDPTWYATYLAYWSSIEVNVAIVCACMPALNQLMKKLFPTTWKSSTRQYELRDESGGKNGVRNYAVGNSAEQRSKPKVSGSSTRDLTGSDTVYSDDGFQGSLGDIMEKKPDTPAHADEDKIKAAV